MSERMSPISELFPSMPKSKAEILARGMTFVAATYGCTCACKICFIPAPINVQKYLPSETLFAVNDFIGKHDPTGTGYLSFHEAGQLSDYYDPQTECDMADVVSDCLKKTNKTVAIFLHGIDRNDVRAIEATKKLWKLPESIKNRVEVTVSTDCFGPVNVPEDVAESIGRERVLNALQLFHNWPRLVLKAFTTDHNMDAKVDRVRYLFGEYTPAEVEIAPILMPTRVRLPGVDRYASLEKCIGYGISTDGSIVVKRHAGPLKWSTIGSLTELDPEKILPLSSMVI